MKEEARVFYPSFPRWGKFAVRCWKSD
jgi:hypothetical protein